MVAEGDAFKRSYSEAKKKRSYSEATKSDVEESELADVKFLLRDIQGRLGAITEQVNIHNGRLGSIADMITKSDKAAPDKAEDPRRCMITGADLRDDAQRNGQKNNDPEPSRFKKLMKMEGVDVDCLQTLGRYGSKLAILFHTSLDAQKFMQDFKKIKPAGATGPRSPRIAPPPRSSST